jgi:electron transfer flavoprotein alpha subunit
MQISDILSVEGQTRSRARSMPAMRSPPCRPDDKKVITVRGTAFAKAAPAGGSGTVEAVGCGRHAGLSTFVGAEIANPNVPS